jgi:hypothetical protein
VALTSIAAGLLAACGVPPGGADITISGAVTADDPEGAVICKQPGEDGETTIPTWQWTGTIDGEPAQLLFSSQVSSVPEEGGLQIGGRSWIRFVAFDNGSTVAPQPVSDDGTLRLTAHIEPTPGQTGEAVDIVATLRCPGWGDVGLGGDVSGELDGVSRCPAPGEGGSDAYVTYEVRSAQLAGQPTGTIAFAGLNGPAVDTALLQSGGVLWGAVNTAGQTPQVTASVDDDGVLTATATFTRLDGQPGAVTADATIRCP